MRPSRIFLIATLLAGAGVFAADPLPIEVYGKLPTVSQLAISPSGERIALRRKTDEYDVVLVVDMLSAETVGMVRVDEIKPRDVYFATETKLILVVSQTARRIYVQGPWELSAAFVYDLESNEVKQLLKGFDKLYSVQSGLGRIIGQSTDGRRVYMPAYLGPDSGNPSYGLLEVDLERVSTKRLKWGTRDTIDWFVDSEGRPIAEELHDQSDDLYQVYSYATGERTLIHEQESDLPPILLEGVMPDGKSLLFASHRNDADYESYYTMDLFDGSIVGPLFEREGASVDYPVTDINRVVHGVRYAGFFPSYRFIDAALDERVKRTLDRGNGAALSLTDWSDDFDKLLVYATGAWTAGAWFLVSNDDSPIEKLAAARPDVSDEHVAPTTIIEYPARDGLEIAALVTAMAEVREAGNAPLIVLPHGGPASYDRFEFDWLAQYLASRGMVVLQPQFRGSRGFGRPFELAGEGEWGRKMSTDLDDGALRLIADGLADGERVCIVGASYGGYAALAAAAFSEFEYKCAVSIAGISDLQKMLAYDTRRAGRSHWVVSYWENQFGAGKRDDELLAAISPIHAIEAIDNPVLLIHGKDDTVVPHTQSNDMFKALKRAKKPVEYVKLQGEDHYLSEGESRLATLQAIDRFLREHL